MTTALPVGTFFRHRYKNAWEYAQITTVDNKPAYQVIGEDQIFPNTTIHECVWTNHRTHLESRRTYVKEA